MERWQRRAVKTITGIVVLVFLTSLAYHYVMIVFEGRSSSYFHSTQVVVETFPGTGYGSDSPWESAVGNLFVIVMGLSTFCSCLSFSRTSSGPSSSGRSRRRYRRRRSSRITSWCVATAPASNDSASETKARQAGADYVLSLPDISGRLLALDVLRDASIS
ncbi:NAD-binding protein 1 (Kef-type transporter subunit), partial [Natronobacterium gregoryi SP2]